MIPVMMMVVMMVVMTVVMMVMMVVVMIVVVVVMVMVMMVMMVMMVRVRMRMIMVVMMVVVMIVVVMVMVMMVMRVMMMSNYWTVSNSDFADSYSSPKRAHFAHRKYGVMFFSSLSEPASCGCHELPLTGRLKATQLFSLAVLGVRSAKSRCEQA